MALSVYAVIDGDAGDEIDLSDEYRNPFPVSDLAEAEKIAAIRGKHQPVRIVKITEVAVYAPAPRREDIA